MAAEMTGYLRHVQSGLFVHPQGGRGKKNVKLVLHPGGGERRLLWKFTDNGCVEHVESGLFVHPQGGEARMNVKLLLHPNDGGAPLHWRIEPDGSLIHTQTGLAVHPQGGYGGMGVELLCHPGRGEDRLRFELVPEEEAVPPLEAGDDSFKACAVCSAQVHKSAFSKRQWNKGARRVCQNCKDAPPGTGPLASLLCDESKAHPRDVKIDAHTGEYLPYPGATIVMHLIDQSIGEELYDLLNTADITDHLALLPVPSYHVTLRAVGERCHFPNGRAYNNAMEKWYPKLQQLEALFERTCGTEPMRFSNGVNAPRGCSLRLVPADGSTEDRLSQLEGAVAKALGFNRKRQKLHLTFGYPWGGAEGKDSLNKALRTTSARSAMFVDAHPVLVCDRPRVCWFHDMTAFHPAFPGGEE